MHIEDEVQSEQFIGQTKHDPLDKYLPYLQVKQDYDVDKEQVKQLFESMQHSLTEVKE